MKKINLTNWRDKKWLTRPAQGQHVDGQEVLEGLPSSPVARLQYVDAELLYVSWIWDHQPDQPRLTVIERADVDTALTRLAQALPTPLQGESGAEALERAIASGDLLDPERELELAHDLTRALIPFVLGLELNQLEMRGIRPRLRIQSSPTTAQVPWELLGTNGHERTLDMVDVAMLLPASIRNDPERRVAKWRPDGAVVSVLDPAVPGFAANSELGSVFGPIDENGRLARRLRDIGTRLRPLGDDVLEMFRRTDLDRLELARLLGESGNGDGDEDGVGDLDTQAACRLLYAGHVTASTHALDARLHLADTADVAGRTTPLSSHRPYSAADIAVGAPGLTPLNAPNRVALIACDSGSDLRFAEATGLVAAFTHRGAEFVTATRWTLPTEAGLARFGLGERATGMLTDAVVAIDRAQAAPDPVVALGAWQREQRKRWSETGDPAYSPIMWAAFTTAWSPAPTLVPGELEPSRVSADDNGD